MMSKEVIELDNISHRISLIIQQRGIKKVEFARKIGVSQAFVSELCSGAKNPSDRTISDICREFNVSETWLRTGEGEMFLAKSCDEALKDFFDSVLSAEDSDFRRRLLSAMSQMTPEQWTLLEDMVNKLCSPPLLTTL